MSCVSFYKVCHLWTVSVYNFGILFFMDKLAKNDRFNAVMAGWRFCGELSTRCSAAVRTFRISALVHCRRSIKATRSAPGLSPGLGYSSILNGFTWFIYQLNVFYGKLFFIFNKLFIFFQCLWLLKIIGYNEKLVVQHRVIRKLWG